MIDPIEQPKVVDLPEWLELLKPAASAPPAPDLPRVTCPDLERQAAPAPRPLIDGQLREWLEIVAAIAVGVAGGLLLYGWIYLVTFSGHGE